MPIQFNTLKAWRLLVYGTFVCHCRSISVFWGSSISILPTSTIITFHFQPGCHNCCWLGSQDLPHLINKSSTFRTVRPTVVSCNPSLTPMSSRLRYFRQHSHPTSNWSSMLSLVYPLLHPWRYSVGRMILIISADFTTDPTRTFELSIAKSLYFAVRHGYSSTDDWLPMFYWYCLPLQSLIGTLLLYL